MKWRAIKGDDLRHVYRVADEIYPPHLFETNDALLARINMGAGYSHVLVEDREVFGYVIAHPWDLSIPALGLGTGYPKSAFRTVFLHDLAILPRQRRQGHGAEAAELVKAIAGTAFGSVRLVAVNGSVPFWSGQGFRNVDAPTDGLASYGADANLMEWRP